jgi:hypothetical protein
MTRVWVLLAAALLSSRCGGGSTAPSPVPTSPPSSSPGVSYPPAFLVGAGDIADCKLPGSEATARLLDRFGGTVFTAGDNAYPTGSATDYRNCYHPTWGRHLDRTQPIPGNHEYEQANAAPYFQYFGARAGAQGLGFYSFDLGAWHVVALNSEVAMGTGSPQQGWLRDDLGATNRKCAVAIIHRPLFSSGEHGNNVDTRSLWSTLYDFGVEVVISGHDHLYERFAPQAPDGRTDPLKGIRQFVVGTGGSGLRGFMAPKSNSEARGSVWGVLAMTLLDGSYTWEFVPVEGASFRDGGTGTCH